MSDAKPDDSELKIDWRALLTFPEKVGWRDHVIGFAIAAIYTGILIVTARTLGFARDEGFYFSAGSSDRASVAPWTRSTRTRPLPR